MIETEVTMTLGRTTGGDSEKPWRLEVTDRRSRSRILEVRFDNDTFADLLSSTASGRLGQAQVLVEPWIGRWALHRLIRVDLGHKYGDAFRQAVDQARSHPVHHDPILSGDDGWQYTGYQDGEGGSSFRTLTFVKYLDHEPTEEEIQEAREIQ